MLNPRLSVVRPLSICLWFGSIAALGVCGGFVGCQGPDTFLRNPGPASGGNKGSGGTSFGSGGHVGSGGTTGLGGTSSGSGGSGMGGAVVGTGGRTGAGGTAMGGMTGGGGMITGSGGARDAGADMPTGAGGAIVDASRDSEGGIVGGGTGPCMSLCSPAISVVFPAGSNDYHSGSIGVGAGCYETAINIQGIVCSSFNANGGTRVLSVNGVVDPTCDFNNVAFPAPPKVNGGYCLQISAGVPDFAAIAVF